MLLMQSGIGLRVGGMAERHVDNSFIHEMLNVTMRVPLSELCLNGVWTLSELCLNVV